jgi:hypothetical protein
MKRKSLRLTLNADGELKLCCFEDWFVMPKLVVPVLFPPKR